MDIYLFRHGDAEEGTSRRDDRERQLTERGKRETRRVAEALRRAGVRPDRIISTSLLRAQQTAEILCKALGVEVAPSGLPAETRLGDVERAVERGGDCIVIVGHAPYLGQVAGQLTGGPALDLAKSGCVRIEAPYVGPATGRLIWLLTPELFP